MLYFYLKFVDGKKCIWMVSSDRLNTLLEKYCKNEDSVYYNYCVCAQKDLEESTLPEVCVSCYATSKKILIP